MKQAVIGNRRASAREYGHKTHGGPDFPTSVRMLAMPIRHSVVIMVRRMLRGRDGQDAFVTENVTEYNVTDSEKISEPFVPL